MTAGQDFTAAHVVLGSLREATIAEIVSSAAQQERRMLVTLRVGLIADTHMPERWPRIPPLVEKHFSGVDLVLHAGDVDALGSITPTIAVHGNDETDEAAAALPYCWLLGLADHRVLLRHSHHPDRADEMASRKADEWAPKLRRRASQAKRHGASIHVYGHTHMPMAESVDGVLLLNPGAIASGNAVCRQTVQTVAVLEAASSGSARAQALSCR